MEKTQAAFPVNISKVQTPRFKREPGSAEGWPLVVLTPCFLTHTLC